MHSKNSFNYSLLRETRNKSSRSQVPHNFAVPYQLASVDSRVRRADTSKSSAIVCREFRLQESSLPGPYRRTRTVSTWNSLSPPTASFCMTYCLCKRGGSTTRRRQPSWRGTLASAAPAAAAVSSRFSRRTRSDKPGHRQRFNFHVSQLSVDLLLLLFGFRTVSELRFLSTRSRGCLRPRAYRRSREGERTVD